MPRQKNHVSGRAKYGGLIFLLAWTFATRAFATGGDLDATFDPGTGANDVLETIVLQSDGKIIIGGLFTDYNGTARNRIARLNANGTLDPTFDPGTGADNIVWAAAAQPDGKTIICGAFAHINGTPRDNTARLNANGSLDLAFYPPQIVSADATVMTTALQADGKIVVGGPFGVARWTADDGGNDIPFNTAVGSGPNRVVLATAVQADGKILIGGDFSSFDGTSVVRVARLNSTGTLDPAFNPGSGANDFLRAIAVQANGKILIGGAFTTYNGTAVNRIARLNPDGSLDLTFLQGTGANDLLRTIAVQGDGKIIIGGAFTTYNGVARNHLARLNPDGSLDTTFAPDPAVNDTVVTIALQPDGKILFGGFFTAYNGTPRNRVARVLPVPGKISFSAAAYSVGEGDGSATVTVTRTGGTDGRVFARISLTDVTTSPADYIFTPAALDTSFNPVGATSGFGANFVQTAAIQTDGKILVGGFYFNYGGIFRKGIARLNPNGVLDATFDPGAGTAQNSGGNAVVLTTVLQPDGKILIGGDFTVYDGSPRNFVARLNPNGSLDPSFDAGSIASQPVRTIAVQPDGKVIIGGDYVTYNGIDRTTITRLNANGSLDLSFNPGFIGPGPVTTVLLQPDGKIVIAGEFQFYNSTPRNFIARLNSAGALDPSFAPGTGANSDVFGVALQPDGKLLVVGGFSMFNGVPANFIVRLNSDGSVDPAFDPGTGPSGYPKSIALQPDGKIIIVGDFQDYNGIERELIARLNPDGSLDPSFNPGAGTNTGLRVVALQPDGAIFIGGGFSNYNGIIRRGIARLANGDFFVVWPAGDASNKTFQLPIVDDLLHEANETLTLGLIPVSGGATFGLFPTATLTIIDNDNTAPVAGNQAVTTGVDTAKPITVTGSDADGDALTFTVTSGPAHGALSGSAPSLLYTPGAGYSGRDSFTFKVNDGRADSNFDGTVSITVATTFASWQQGFFTPQELGDPAISGEAADPDGDGLSNLVEYAFHFNPRQPSNLNRPYTVVDPNYISLIYPKAISATDLTYTIEASSDLLNWAAVIPANVILSDDGITQIVKAQVPLIAGQPSFLRLRVSH